jgi:hypothetical protein
MLKVELPLRASSKHSERVKQGARDWSHYSTQDSQLPEEAKRAASKEEDTSKISECTVSACNERV